jgi:alanine racemase
VTLRLRVDTHAWRAHVERVAASYATLVPVVKGNGYGFGRVALAELATDLLAGLGGGDDLPTLAVGTVHELAGLPSGVRPLVLTPPAPDGGASGSRTIADRLTQAPVSPIVTVGAPEHVDVLGDWRGAVLIKLQTTMRRFGVSTDDRDWFEKYVADAGFSVVGYSAHLALAGDDRERVAEVEAWLGELPPALDPGGPRPSLWLSHLGPPAYAALCHRWPRWRFPMRIGTGLWHGDKAALHLGANVIDFHPVKAGSLAGYHGATVAADGHLVIVGAGTAHGVAPLDDGRSPFHYLRRRLDLVERPHMHTSMVLVPEGCDCPQVGDVVDVQRPLTEVTVDEVIWQ